MTPILLLEDDAAIAATIAYALAREGYAVTQVMLVHEAELRLAATPPALAILDVGLPDGSGLDLLRRLRERGSQLPVLMLTARAEEFDRVLGLELGADDYLTKRIRYAGTWLTLTRLEYGLLRTLLRAPARIHSRDALLTAAWGHQADPMDRTVDTHIKTLRAKLRACTPGHDPIATHRGMGYSITA